MLKSLCVKNLALMEHCEVSFSDGLNVLTGETGAGKSLLLGSINLALGNGSDKDMIRAGCEEASVELVFDATSRIVDKLKEMDLPYDEEDVILIHKITPTKSTFKINGETVLKKNVKELAFDLLDVHGQHEHQSLLNENKQRDMIDAYEGDQTRAAKEEVSKAYLDYKSALKELEDLLEEGGNMDREKSLLSYELNEIDEANLQVGEDEELEKTYKKMTSSRKLSESVSLASNFISGYSGQDAGTYVSYAIHELSKVSMDDEDALSLEETLKEAENLLGDFSIAASKYLSDLEFSEEEFSNVESRLDTINSLKHRFGNSIEAIFSYRDKIAKKLSDMEHFEERVAELSKKKQSCLSLYKQNASLLSKLRNDASVSFAKELIATLSELNFPQVSFRVDVQSDFELISANGYDKVSFLISTNPGESLKPLKNVASGGELSRIMLGIKTILAKKDTIDCLIFDEIDTGISGRTAWEVAKKLARLSKEHQVILITHLSQIAAMADTHFEIAKSVTNNFTKTSLTLLTEEGSIEELARLLGSDVKDDAAVLNAKELKKKALQEKEKYCETK